MTPRNLKAIAKGEQAAVLIVAFYAVVSGLMSWSVVAWAQEHGGLPTSSAVDMGSLLGTYGPMGLVFVLANKALNHVGHALAHVDRLVPLAERLLNSIERIVDKIDDGGALFAVDHRHEGAPGDD